LGGSNHYHSKVTPGLKHLDKQFEVKPTVAPDQCGSLLSKMRGPDSVNYDHFAAVCADMPLSPKLLIKTGTMMKVGGFMKSWKNRYFKLYAKSLEYYASSGSELKGTIELNSSIEVRRGDSVSESFPRMKGVGSERYLLLDTSKRTHVFSCPSEEEREVDIELKEVTQ